MGLFVTQTFAGGKSSEGQPVTAPFLMVDIHDSDIATITFQPGPEAGGLVYLGYQPRDYFDDDTASADVDLDRQASALAVWAQEVTGTGVEASSIRPLLAEEGVEEPMDVFVEETVDRLLETLGVPRFPWEEV